MSIPCAEKIFINLNAPPAFQLRQKILGDNNANLQYIFLETKASVSLRGQGSGFLENGAESNEPLYLMIEHQALKNVIEAKGLAKNLIETIQQDLQIFLQMNQQASIQIQPPMIQTSQQQITIPQAVLSCPPPNIIQQPTHIIQQQNYIPQHHMQIPMQIIQQTPPPTTAIRAGTPIVQFQGQTASLQPANIQLQSTNGGQQILLNQAPTQQYQLQYIPTTNQITNGSQMQIQHVIQPQQQMVQQPGLKELFTGGQQFITVQGNHFMIPPPSIIQQTQPQTIYNPPPTINLKPEELKSDGIIKHDDGNDQKDNQQNTTQMGTRILTNIPLNQPPPILNCPPPQIFNQQAANQIQQFVVNTNAWPQSQAIQQLPLNSQIQIVTQQQPQAMRSGNEIVIQNSGQGGQQVFTTFNSQQQQQFQQIQFHQATITQPPPSQAPLQNVQSNQQSISFQQQFEQKINQSIDNLQQMRSGKRKFEGEAEADSNKAFPKKGMGPNSSDRSTPPKAKTRMMPPNQTQTYQQPPKNLNVNNSGSSGVQKNVQNKPMFNPLQKNNVVATGCRVGASLEAVKPPVVLIESKGSNLTASNENESSEGNVMNHLAAQNPNFMMRPGNQSYRFQGPQSFLHQQPPPITQNAQFSGQRGQIMSNSSMNAYQNVGQGQMMQQPPPPVTTTHQFIQQDMNVYQHNNFHTASHQGNMNRFQSPQQGPMDNETMTGNFQQQPRFRQW